MFGTLLSCSKEIAQSTRETGEIGAFKAPNSRSSQTFCKAITKCRYTGTPGISLMPTSTDRYAMSTSSSKGVCWQAKKAQRWTWLAHWGFNLSKGKVVLFWSSHAYGADPQNNWQVLPVNTWMLDTLHPSGKISAWVRQRKSQAQSLRHFQGITKAVTFPWDITGLISHWAGALPQLIIF